VRLLLATHRHKDHFDASTVQRHLLSNPRAVAGGPPQVAQQINGARVWSLQPGATRKAGTIEIRVFRVPHNEPHEKTIENNVYLLTLRGKKVVVTGDAIVSPQAFRDAGLANQKPDIFVAPFWFALSTRGREILDQVIQAPSYWAIHGELESRGKWRAQVLQHYPKAQIP
jgi:L-ascorbate metabolism protein UlaG (beta-lactamase superfamily)